MKRNVLVIMLLVGMFCGASYYEHNYTRQDCVVVEASPTGAIFEDRCGFTWYWEEEGFEVGDVVDLKMYDNCSSAYIDDDEIKKVIKRHKVKIY